MSAGNGAGRPCQTCRHPQAMRLNQGVGACSLTVPTRCRCAAYSRPPIRRREQSLEQPALLQLVDDDALAQRGQL